MNEENLIEKSDADMGTPSLMHYISLEHKIAAGICVLLFLLYGIAYFFQPEQEKILESFPINMSETEGEGDGEFRETTTHGTYYVGPAPL